MKKLVSFVFCLFICFFFFTYRVLAIENFSTANDVVYIINESGITHADFAITLTNTTSQYYASSYTMNVGFTHIQNITISDSNGIITPIITKKEDGYLIEIPLNKNPVGIGKSFTFHLSFDTPDIAIQQGKIWEVNIPGVKNQSDFGSFTVHVKTPSSFGEPSYSKPKFISSLDRNNLDFTKEDLQNSGISLAFGNEQTYGFNLLYHLKNNNLFPIKTEIALPPSTNYQDVFIKNINPPPLQVITDQDGNWLAQFYLPPGTVKNIAVKGNVRLYLSPKEKPQTEENLESYTKEKPYWQTNNEQIKKLAKELKTPKVIYDYVVKSLYYDFSRVNEQKPRIGALGVLKNTSSAVCLEFTDLFIALARAAGIPSREIDGFAFTQNSKQRPLSLVKDILHAWPEYYDKDRKQWIMVDPTWENTSGVDYFNTLDFDHFTFAIKGVDSSYPIPAGGYKLAGKSDVKDVEVFFSKSDEQITQTFQVLTKRTDTTTINHDKKAVLIGGGIISAGILSIIILFIAARTRRLSFFR